ncbi:DUF5937 family protein [Streptomyces boncukensis]|uniref:Metalloregulator ArsR/SmtB family transcription factor n=1 Tax=Streptomyces boncukensis TaxID=2711219 RepID=A0A6G4WZ33_9ACTN|nr:DUF5937 family protein [Streptomyces boncukensis]NGO70122.1 metalloregulator ArsR/SmtB family transcription factor [Streptomyces boncukensis]
MSVTIEIAGLPPERIVFSPSPLAELGGALHALAEPGHHPALHAWTTATNAALKPDLADRLCEAEFLWRSTRADILLPADPKPTLREELDDLDRLSDERFVESALEISCSEDAYTNGPSPLVDQRAKQAALDRATVRGPRQADFAARLLEDPRTVRAWIRRLLEDCETAFFGDLWQRIRTQLAADARHKTELFRRRGLAAALEAVSPAIALDEEGPAPRIVVDKLSEGRTWAADPALPGGPGLTFLPTLIGQPHLFALYAHGWQPVVLYPVATPELPQPIALDLMQRRLEALSHPRRMRMCLSLSRAPYTTGELADITGMSAPEVSRHLKVMKNAGLLITRRRGRYVHYRLDLSVVARMGSDYVGAVLR